MIFQGVPQTQSTTYFPVAMGAYVAPLPPVKPTNNGSLGKALGMISASPMQKAVGLSSDDGAMWGAFLLIGGGLSFYIGRALAPKPSDRMVYGVSGAILGLISPYIGLAALAAYSMSKRG